MPAWRAAWRRPWRVHVWCRTAFLARPCLQHAGMQNARENTGIPVVGVCSCAPPWCSVHGRGRRVALPGKANSTTMVSVVSPLVVARTTGRSRGRRPCGYYRHEYGSGRAARNTRFVCIGWKVVVATRDLMMWLCLCMWCICMCALHALSVCSAAWGPHHLWSRPQVARLWSRALLVLCWHGSCPVPTTM